MMHFPLCDMQHLGVARHTDVHTHTVTDFVSLLGGLTHEAWL